MATDEATLSAAVAGGIAALAGIVAAIYAIRTFRRMGVDSSRAEERHLATIQPRPTFQSPKLLPESRNPATLEVRPINPGGAAVRWVTILHARTHIFKHDGPCPAHYEMPPGGWKRIQSSGSGLLDCTATPTRVLGSYALDIEGAAWDLLQGKRTQQSLAEYFSERLSPLGIAVDENGNLSALHGAGGATGTPPQENILSPRDSGIGQPPTP